MEPSVLWKCRISRGGFPGIAVMVFAPSDARAIELALAWAEGYCTGMYDAPSELSAEVERIYTRVFKL